MRIPLLTFEMCRNHRTDGFGRSSFPSEVERVDTGVGEVYEVGEGVLGHGVELAIEGDLQRQEIDEQESKCMDRI